MDLGLRDRVYLVTGGSRGLGFAAARALVADGARVLLSAPHESTAAAAAARLAQDAGSGAAAWAVVDNADPAAPRELITAARDRFGRLDGALISVGGSPAGTVADTGDAAWRSAFESVFLGALRIARAVARAGSEGTSIAFVLSSSVKSPINGLAISNGLRPGLAMVAKTLADELGPNGTRVNGLMPGRISTDRLKELDGKSGDPEAARRASEKTIPLRRYGTPEEFGRVAAFILSPAASYLTGTIIPIDGGALRTI